MDSRFDRDRVIMVLTKMLNGGLNATELNAEQLKALRDAIELLKPPKRESRAKLPCPCGRKRLDITIGVLKDGSLKHYISCPICDREAGGETYMDAVRAWNDMVRKENDNAG